MCSIQSILLRWPQDILSSKAKEISAWNPEKLFVLENAWIKTERGLVEEDLLSCSSLLRSVSAVRKKGNLV